uniref:Ribosomal protein L16 n=1 Tax=Strombidium sp. TaxID=181122 RepID=A0A7T0M4W9_9SPIT|nr:ribosomal protein L16 [Strombidium sp.]
MVLRPRKFKFKNKQKKRSYIKISQKPIKLVYGQYGLVTLQPLKLYSKQIFRFKLFLKKGAKRADKTKRQVWFNMFPHLPLTRKVSGSRMGKGKGKLSGWVSVVTTKTNLFEFKNLRIGRAYYYLNQMRYKLQIKTAICVAVGINSHLHSIWKPRKMLKSEIFW